MQNGQTNCVLDYEESINGGKLQKTAASYGAILPEECANVRTGFRTTLSGLGKGDNSRK